MVNIEDSTNINNIFSVSENSLYCPGTKTFNEAAFLCYFFEAELGRRSFLLLNPH